MFLASVVVNFPAVAAIADGAVADALMAEHDIVTVKVPGEGATAEFRADVDAATRDGAALGREAWIVSIKLQTEAERLRALEGAKGYGPFAF